VEVRTSLTRYWYAFANAVGGFIEEAAERLSLAWAVLRGASPKPLEKRWWNRATETPVLVDVYDWTDDRLIFSVLVWPSLEAPPEIAAHAQEARAKQVMRVLHAGAAEMAWSTRYEVDYGLRWDAEREVWAATDGFAYDGEWVFDYSREGGGGKLWRFVPGLEPMVAAVEHKLCITLSTA
jgi:hypothetical protein